jgi:hypothetical protein
MARIYPAPTAGGGGETVEENLIADQVDAMVSYN